MADVPTWQEIGKAARALSARLSGDRFLKTVFAGCIDVGKRRGNPIRGNLVAAGLREALGHVIHKLSPDEEVRTCVWFVQATDTRTVTRRQRANYIIQAGLPDDFVENVLGFDVKSYADELIDMVEALNKATHVRPDTIVTDGKAIRRMFMDVVSELAALLKAASESRRAVEDEVGTAMQNAVFAALIGEAIQELDELSRHTVVDHHWTDGIRVEAMDAETIAYSVEGTIAVELQYGSGSDVANGIGLRTSDSYPYEAKVECSIKSPLDVHVGDIRLKVDTSSFYE